MILETVATVSTVLFLASLGNALVFYDRHRKMLRVADRSYRVIEIQERQKAALRETAAHWCNEAIKLERALLKERAERQRWEHAYASRLEDTIS